MTKEQEDKTQTLIDEAYERVNVVRLNRGSNEMTTGGLRAVVGYEVLEGLLEQLRDHDAFVERYANTLSADELEALELTAKLANKLRKIIKDGGSDQEPHDWAEAAAKIHDIQHMLMAQAAVRSYPERFRGLGGRIEK